MQIFDNADWCIKKHLQLLCQANKRLIRNFWRKKITIDSFPGKQKFVDAAKLLKLICKKGWSSTSKATFWHLVLQQCELQNTAQHFDKLYRVMKVKVAFYFGTEYRRLFQLCDRFANYVCLNEAPLCFDCFFSTLLFKCRCCVRATPKWWLLLGIL